jgi:hypothetical protein
MKSKSVVPVEPFAFTINEFCSFYPSSRASVSNWIRSGELQSFRNGNRRLIPLDAAREFAKRKATGGGAIPPDVSAMKSAAGRKGREVQLTERADDKAA